MLADLLLACLVELVALVLLLLECTLQVVHRYFHFNDFAFLSLELLRLELETFLQGCKARSGLLKLLLLAFKARQLLLERLEFAVKLSNALAVSLVFRDQVLNLSLLVVEQER